MKVIIAGSRSIDDYDLVCQAIKESGWEDKITEVVSGDCYGIDKLGAEWAIYRHIPIKTFPARWDLYGLSAGPIRNAKMAEYADALILIWSGSSKGSKSMKEKAEVARIPIYEKIILEKETT